LLAGVPRRVHSEHGFDVDNLKGENWKPALLRRLHSPLVNRYVTVSKDLKRILIEHIGIGAGRITQIYNGVDTERFTPQATGKLADLPPAFQSDGLFVIGTVGRLQQVKDQASLLRAFAALLQMHPEWRSRLRLLIVGDGPLMSELRQLAVSLRIDDLSWFPGALNEVPAALGMMDVFSLPSLNEGISNTLLEAMASGLPAIVTEVGGNVELVEDGVCGRFFSPGDVTQLSAILNDYVADPALRQSHSQAARQIAEQRYSLSAMVEAYAAIYETLSR
jgi:sugar transferase (PEP-CTERM/EpsH1 system associated)